MCHEVFIHVNKTVNFYFLSISIIWLCSLYHFYIFRVFTTLFFFLLLIYSFYILFTFFPSIWSHVVVNIIYNVRFTWFVFRLYKSNVLFLYWVYIRRTFFMSNLYICWLFVITGFVLTWPYFCLCIWLLHLILWIFI